MLQVCNVPSQPYVFKYVIPVGDDVLGDREHFCV